MTTFYQVAVQRMRSKSHLICDSKCHCLFPATKIPNKSNTQKYMHDRLGQSQVRPLRPVGEFGRLPLRGKPLPQPPSSEPHHLHFLGA